MKTAGRIVVIGSTGAVAGVMVLASAAGHTVMAPILPLALLVGGISAYRTQSRVNAESLVIEYEIKRRGFQLPAELTPRAEQRRNAFFPVAQAPQRLLLLYGVGSEQRELRLALPALSGLHSSPMTKKRQRQFDEFGRTAPPCARAITRGAIRVETSAMPAPE